MFSIFINNIKNKFNKFKKYIIKYEIIEDKIKIINSSNEYKYVNNNILNKVKIIEIIKEHKEEINTKINYYDNKKEEYEIIFILNEIILLFLGCIFILSFFIGDTIFFVMTFIILSLYLLIFVNYFYRILLFRNEIHRLKKINEVETK